MTVEQWSNVKTIHIKFKLPTPDDQAKIGWRSVAKSKANARIKGKQASIQFFNKSANAC